MFDGLRRRRDLRAELEAVCAERDAWVGEAELLRGKLEYERGLARTWKELWEEAVDRLHDQAASSGGALP